MSSGRPVLLIVAKAPIPGLVKTRLTPPFTAHQAAALAAAALLDTLDACRTAAVLAAAEVVVALAGDPHRALSGARSGRRWLSASAASAWGRTARLAAAHLDAAGDFDHAAGRHGHPQIQPWCWPRHLAG